MREINMNVRVDHRITIAYQSVQSWEMTNMIIGHKEALAEHKENSGSCPEHWWHLSWNLLNNWVAHIHKRQSQVGIGAEEGYKVKQFILWVNYLMRLKRLLNEAREEIWLLSLGAFQPKLFYDSLKLLTLKEKKGTDLEILWQCNTFAELNGFGNPRWLFWTLLEGCAGSQGRDLRPGTDRPCYLGPETAYGKRRWQMAGICCAQTTHPFLPIPAPQSVLQRVSTHDSTLTVYRCCPFTVESLSQREAGFS